LIIKTGYSNYDNYDINYRYCCLHNCFNSSSCNHCNDTAQTPLGHPEDELYAQTKFRNQCVIQSRPVNWRIINGRREPLGQQKPLGQWKKWTCFVDGNGSSCYLFVL